MKIQHLKYPLNHTIIYDFFNYYEKQSILNEFFEIHNSSETYVADTKHHEKLLNTGNTKAYPIDKIYEDDREKSNIIKHTRKIFTTFDQEDFRNNIFLNYVRLSNKDTLYAQLYDTNSSYYKHTDFSVLTILYIFHIEPQDGNKFIFNDYNYAPHITDNCCLIFPSFFFHEVLPVESKRISLTHQLYIS